MIEHVLKFYGVPMNEHPLSRLIELHCSLTHSVISEFLTLIDCPDDGRCLVHMRQTCGYLINSFFAELNEQVPISINKAHGSLWDAISIVAINDERLKQERMPTKSVNPIYTFHFETSPSTPGNPLHKAKNQQIYASLAGFLHQRLNHWFNVIYEEKPTIKQLDYKSHLGLAARKIIRGSTGVSSNNGFNLTRLERALLSAQLDQSITVIGTKLLAVGDVSYLKDLLVRDSRKQSKHDVESRKFKGRKKRWLTSHFQLIASKTERSYQLMPTGPFIHSYEDSEDHDCTTMHFYVDDFEGEATIQTTVTQPPEWTLTGWEQKRKNIGKVENSVQIYNIQPWDNRCVSLQSLRLIYKHLMHREKLPKKIKFIILMLLMTGISTNALLNIGHMKLPTTVNDDDIDMEAIATNNIWFDADLGIIWWVSQSTSNKDGAYFFVDNFHEIKLPKIICDALNAIPNTERQLRKKDLTLAKRFLKSLPNDSLMTITPLRLSLTFRAYFINGAGLPNIYADYIIGAKSAHLFSQHCYITVPHDFLIKAWHSMCNNFISGLSSHGSLDDVLKSMTFKPLGLNNVIKWEHEPCLGSPLTPKMSALKQHLKFLYCQFPHNANELLLCGDKAWNYYMAYVYTFYALCTGQRPNRNPIPSRKLINTDIKTAYVSDKNNRFFKEHRDIYLCQSVITLLKRHQIISKKWLLKKRNQGYTLNGDLGAFFVAHTSEKNLIPVSPNVLDKLLLNQSSAYFSGLTNGCRHLLLSLLHLNGSPQEYIDFISGHRHEGFEPTHICSPISYQHIGRYLAKTIESKVIPLFELVQPIMEE